MNELDTLKNLVLAPYILKATALINVSRKIGGNQFRHSFFTLGVIMDYKYFYNSKLAKAALLHDYLEDIKHAKEEDMYNIDSEGRQVAKLVVEVTRKKSETKEEYLERLLKNGSDEALILKSADRISNLTDMNINIFNKRYISDYLDQTEKYVLPMAKKVNKHMEFELKDLIKKRRGFLK